jgi:hypothetical protein
LLDVRGAILVNVPPWQDDETVRKHPQDRDEQQARGNDDIVGKTVANGGCDSDDCYHKRRNGHYRDTACKDELLQSQPELLEVAF